MMKVTNDFYRQFEELNNKLDSLLKENKDLRREFKQEKEDLKATIKEKDELIEKLLNEIDRLKNQINKNSSNSSKPPSTDTGKKKVEPIYIILETIYMTTKKEMYHQLLNIAHISFKSFIFFKYILYSSFVITL